MTLGTPTRKDDESTKGDALFFDDLTFLGDDNYTTGGTADFDSFVQALVGDSRDVIAIIPGDCGDHIPLYIKDVGATEGLLMIRLLSTGAELGNGVDLSGTTLNMTVVSK